MMPAGKKELDEQHTGPLGIDSSFVDNVGKGFYQSQGSDEDEGCRSIPGRFGNLKNGEVRKFTQKQRY